MPTSQPRTLTRVHSIIQLLELRSVIDLGVGHGKTGVLLREYLDVMHERYHRAEWGVQIFGIEGFAGYANPLWDYAYDSVLVGDAMEGLEEMPYVDLIIALDIWEHFSSVYAGRILDLCLRKGKYLLLSTPMEPLPQGSVLGNSYEQHLSRWSPSDFSQVPHQHLTCTSDDWIILLSSSCEIPQQIRALSSPFRAIPEGLQMPISQWTRKPTKIFS